MDERWWPWKRGAARRRGPTNEASLTLEDGRGWSEQAGSVFDQYATGLPSAQNAVDALPGWLSALPPDLGVKAGILPLYDDERIRWLIEQHGPVAGRRILELGPLEAGHTCMLEQAGADVVAIEANRLAFLKCLVVKEIVGLRSARFRVGDFIAALEEESTRYDLVVASGVLYHQQDPLRLLSAIAQRTDAVYLWTHYVPDGEREPTRTVTFAGLEVRLFEATYEGGHRLSTFAGGPVDTHHWMAGDDLLAVLAALGFTDQKAADGGTETPPSVSVFARRAERHPRR
ncbi:DUF1698 domain-containing protein [Enterovirga sp.]|jgi:hypothetical protein|uniref:class I SAM-dependent methyltransferase n=1 Tax=Enterovirga sp. TaxID=2026350 RepID=UPI0026307C57|nr:DUF1698 domain-containing protein [Enterovirga sp.]MDB5592224.1 hypothetical protein [Enterovirga sp.]